MRLATLHLLLTGSTILCFVGIIYAVASARLGISIEKARMRLQAFLYVGTGLCIGALSMISFQSLALTLTLTGTIQSSHTRSEGRGHRTYFLVASTSGELVQLNASGLSPYFHTGQKVQVSYKAFSGSVIKAHFISLQEEEEAAFNGTDTWPPYWFLLGGIFIVWQGHRKNKHDPEGERSF